MIHARVCGYYTSGFDDLSTYAPDPPDDFAYEFNFELCPVDAPGVNTWAMTVCTPKWLQRQLSQGEPVSGRHHLFVSKHDLPKLIAFIESFVDEIRVETWEALVETMDRIAWFRD